MSTTTPSESSSARRNVASTTYVAPCSRWASPKASPRRLWATNMWSRTVTLNTALLLGVPDRVTQRRQAPLGKTGHHVGKLVEVGLAGKQRVEGRVSKQLE